MFGRDDLLANARVHAEFFDELALEARLMCFARLALSARKLPQVRQMRALEPASHEEPAVLLNDSGEYDDDVGRRRAHVRRLCVERRARHFIRIGHISHFGLRAVQTIAPRSIRAWLKSNTLR